MRLVLPLILLAACASAPDPDAGTLYRARAASGRGEWMTARVLWKEIYTKGNPSHVVIAGYARSLAELGQPAAASEILTRALADPAPAAKLAMQNATLLGELELHEESLSAWTRAVHDDPACGPARIGRGRVLLLLALHAEALAEGRAAVLLDPLARAGHELVVEAARETLALDDYYRGLTALAAYPPVSAPFLLELTRAGLAVDEEPGLLEPYLAQALVIDPQSVDALRLWGALLDERGELGLAAEKLARAVELEPTDAVTLLALGRIYRTLRDEARLAAVVAHALSFITDDAQRADFEALREAEADDSDQDRSATR